MNKVEFLSTLEKDIMQIPYLEKERIMNYYSETIEDAMEDGVSEEEAIASMGNITDIVKQIHDEHKIEDAGQYKKHSLVLRRSLMVLTLPFWLTPVLLGIVLYLVYITLMLCVGVFIAASIIFVLEACLNVFQIIFANFASGIVLLGVMCLLIGSLPWSWWLFQKMLAYAKLLYKKGLAQGQAYWNKVVG